MYCIWVRYIKVITLGCEQGTFTFGALRNFMLGNIYDFYWSMDLMGFALEIIRKYDWDMNCNGSKLLWVWEAGIAGGVNHSGNQIKPPFQASWQVPRHTGVCRRWAKNSKRRHRSGQRQIDDGKCMMKWVNPEAKFSTLSNELGNNPGVLGCYK